MHAHTHTHTHQTHTVGMNLAKIEICGAKCHVWDVGGKMQDLWSRYYTDCDAVIFVWKIVDDTDKIPSSLRTTNDDNNNNIDSDDERLPYHSAAQQLQWLEQVRSSIPDDVPFLIWGHWFPAEEEENDDDDDDDDDDDVAAVESTKKKQTKEKKILKKNKAYRYNEAYSTGTLLPHYHNPLMSIYMGSTKSGAGVRTAMEWLIPVAARQKKFRDKSPKIEEEEG